MTDSIDHRKVYARGLFDGLRKAGIDNPEQYMQAAKIERMERELNGVARKVLEAVPLSEAWEASKIIGEMVRTTGSSADLKIVTGCLARLVDQGLVREPQRGKFRRVAPRPALSVATPLDPIVAVTESSAPVATAVTGVTAADPMDRLAQLAVTLRQMSDSIATAAKEIEDVAIGAEERFQRIRADTEKLRQLQSLLKSINED